MKVNKEVKRSRKRANKGETKGKEVDSLKDNERELRVIRLLE